MSVLTQALARCINMKTNQALGVFVLIFVSVMGFIGVKVIDHGERISTSETRETYIIKKLDKIDYKLDRVLLR